MRQEDNYGHRLDHENYWSEMAEDKPGRYADETRRTAMNPQQFGDQLTLFNAPLGQPEQGTFKGNPHARLYRAVTVPEHLDTPEKIMEHVNQPRDDRGHDMNMGIHWQHDKEYAEDWAKTIQDHWRRDPTPQQSVIVEADHPGFDHVVHDASPREVHRPQSYNGPAKRLEYKDVMPKGVTEMGGPKNNRLKGEAKDYALIHDTVGPHEDNTYMMPEVPVRPGAPMRVHAVHTYQGDNSFLRNPVQFKGMA